MKVTTSQLKLIMPKCHTEQWVNALNQAMNRFDINTPSRMAAFLAQVAHESAETTILIENLNYSAARLTQVWPARFPGRGALKKPCRGNNNPARPGRPVQKRPS